MRRRSEPVRAREPLANPSRGGALGSESGCVDHAPMKSSRVVASLQLSARAAISCGLAVAVARLLALPYPLYASIAAVLVTDLSAASTRGLAVPRLFGTMLGAAVGAAGSHVLPPSAASAAVGAFAAMFATCLLRMEKAARLAGYLAAIVLVDFRDSPWMYGTYRLLETVIGIGAAVLVSFVPTLIRTAPPRCDDAAE
jgi:uncharacterized membrane protein YgaE (UPF0421/DUF939 family)